jgi:2-methylisocitrate lyase-like PEP mutase family enzyme
MPSVGHNALVELASRLRDMHGEDKPLVLPNAWDVGSALAVERAGARAVATSSSGVAASLGFPDGEMLPAAEMFLMILRIAGAVRVPVTADLEAGYGLSGESLVEKMMQAGAAGLNLEDTDRRGSAPTLVPLDEQADRIADLRRAANRRGVPIVINARVDIFLRAAGGVADQVGETITRANAYRAAGADCIYPIGLTDARAIGRIVRGVDAPINILLRPGAPTIRQLRRLGVRRISVGGGLWMHAQARTEALARRLLSGDGSPFSDLGEE